MGLLDEDLIDNNNVILKYMAKKWLQKHSWSSTLKSHVSFGVSFIRGEVFSAVKLVAEKNIVTLLPYYNYPILLDESAKGNIPDYIDVSKCQIYYYKMNEYR